MNRRTAILTTVFGWLGLGWIVQRNATANTLSNVSFRDDALTQHLLKDFSRNTEDFPLNRYVEIVPIESGGILRKHTDICKSKDPDEIERRVRALAQLAMSVRTSAVIEKLKSDPAISRLSLAAWEEVPANTLFEQIRRQISRISKQHDRKSVAKKVGIELPDLTVIVSPGMAKRIGECPWTVGIYPRDEQYDCPTMIDDSPVVIEDSITVSQSPLTGMKAEFTFPTNAVAVLCRQTPSETDKSTRSTIALRINKANDLRVEIDGENIAVFDQFEVEVACGWSGVIIEDIPQA
jgi:hypothetical protein